MDGVTDAPVVLYVPGLGWFATTAERLSAGLRLGAERLGGTGIAAPGAAPDGGAPVRSRTLLDAEGMATATGVPASWYESAARRGEIPTVHFGRWVRFDLDEVLACARKVGLKRLVGVEHKTMAPALPKHKPRART